MRRRGDATWTARRRFQALLAAGEVGCTGLHGANRLASNSLLEALVVAHRAAEIAIAATLHSPLSAARVLPPWESGNAADPG